MRCDASSRRLVDAARGRSLIMKKPFLLLCAGMFGLANLTGLHAEVKLPAIFGDHMVLQQEAKLPVWGWADPGEKVVVTFGAAKAEATAGADGKWRINLPAVPAGIPPGVLVVAGKNVITISDVLVGDVWLCTGQSNMEWQLRSAHNAKEEIPKANDGQLRLFHVLTTLAIEPRADLIGSWEICSPKTVQNFTAIGYFFGKDLRAALNRPIGLIESSCGGTSVQAWTSLAALEAVPSIRHHVEAFKQFAANFPGGDAEFAANQEAYRKWQRQVHDDPTYQAALKDWTATSTKAKAAGQPVPPQPVPSLPAPRKISFGGRCATIWFNGTLAPVIPYAIKGAIWFQGEGNAGSAADSLEYRILLPTLIADWRTRWGQGDFPFLIGQISNTGTLAKTADEAANWALLRESQSKTLSVANTGMAVSVDLDPAGDVHFTDKVDVGSRLALAARHVAYGEKLVYSGPVYVSMKVEGGSVRVAFKEDSVGGGLIIGSSPWSDPKMPPFSKTELQGFAIAGGDKKWVWAEAKIDGNTIVVTNPTVTRPVAVRYAWADNPPCNLYNKEGLPASPFRTDQW